MVLSKNRKFIGFELDENYYGIASEKINTKVMENLKELLRSGRVVIFDNERSFALGNFKRAECSFRDKPINPWNNGYKLELNGEILIHDTRFDIFVNKLEELKRTWNLEVKSW